MVNLQLTEEEARVLSWVLASVGGSPTTSGRRITDQICEKLWNVNMGYTLDTSKTFPFDPDREQLWFQGDIDPI